MPVLDSWCVALHQIRCRARHTFLECTQLFLPLLHLVGRHLVRAIHLGEFFRRRNRKIVLLDSAFLHYSQLQTDPQYEAGRGRTSPYLVVHKDRLLVVLLHRQIASIYPQSAVIFLSQTEAEVIGEEKTQFTCEGL